MTAGQHRFSCQHMFALILAGGRGSRLGPLTDHRAKPAVPFGGQLRIIDFALSNCVNSGIRRVGVLTQYKAQSLVRHIERGWGFLTDNLGEFIDVVPAQQQQGESWYSGTVDALWQNADLIRQTDAQHVLVLGGDHVYKMDYSAMLREHVERGARVSVACIEVTVEDAREFGVMSVDAHERVRAFDEKPAHPVPLPGRPGKALASMGINLFDTALLLEEMARDAGDPESCHDFGRDLIPSLIGRVPVHAHRFENSCVNMVDGRPYWRDVGTVDAYWAANMDLTRVLPELDLYADDWPILSQLRQLPAAKFVFDDPGRRGMAIDSLVATGCIVSGSVVRRSVLFSKCRINNGSHIEDSLLLPDVITGCGVHLRRVIVDRQCHLPDGFRAGHDHAADRARGFHVSAGGVTLVTADMLALAAVRDDAGRCNDGGARSADGSER